MSCAALMKNQTPVTAVASFVLVAPAHASHNSLSDIVTLLSTPDSVLLRGCSPNASAREVGAKLLDDAAFNFVQLLLMY